MATLKELRQEEREFEESKPISYFLNEIKETLDCAKEDGFDLKDLSEAVRGFDNDSTELNMAYNNCYGNDNRIKVEYTPISSYLYCIGQYIRAIEEKLN